MLGIEGVLTPPQNHIASRPLAKTTTQTTFVDDRSYRTTLKDAPTIRNIWHTFTNLIGYHENTDKEQYWNHDDSKNTEIHNTMNKPIPSHKSIDVLGSTIYTWETHKRNKTHRDDKIPLSKKEKLRTDQTTAMIRRTAMLPVPWARRAHIIATAAIPKTSYGWICRNLPNNPTQKIHTAIHYALDLHSQASRHIARILIGHRCCPHFTAGFQTLAESIRLHVTRSDRDHEKWTPTKNRTAKVSSAWLETIGYTYVNPGIWTHNNADHSIDITKIAEDYDNSTDPKERWAQLKNTISHNIREAWRETLFKTWATGKRVDATNVRDEGPDE